ncbi:MAG: carboxymuconolactone decarboxylase family protein [Thermodesulfobacteriota bacterium]
MSRIGLLGPETAGGDAAAILKEIEAAFGMVPNLFKAYAHHPPVLEANWHKVKAVMMQGGLSRKLKETIAVAVSRDNGCTYCVSAHTAALKSIGVDDRELKAIEEDIDRTDFSVKEKALLDFARKANKAPLRITDAEFEALRASGATRAEIVEALGVMEVFTSFNKFLDSLQVELDF